MYLHHHLALRIKAENCHESSGRGSAPIALREMLGTRVDSVCVRVCAWAAWAGGGSASSSYPGGGSPRASGEDGDAPAPGRST